MLVLTTEIVDIDDAIDVCLEIADNDLYHN